MNVLIAGPLQLDVVKRTVTLNGKPLTLSRKEFELLEYFLRFPSQPVNKAVLSQAIWKTNVATDVRVVDEHVNQLRAKLHTDHHPWIETVHGVSYRFNIPTNNHPKK
jgi:DNA-binding response OmpR family regulator